MKIELKRIDISYVDELQTVFEMSPNYTLKVDGISTVPEDSAKSAIKALPPDIDYKNKYVFLIKYKETSTIRSHMKVCREVSLIETRSCSN